MMNPRPYIEQRLDATPAVLAWQPASVPEMRATQAETRQQLLGALGIAGWERTPLLVKIEKVEQLDGYTRETLVFESRPGLEVFAFFLIPDGCEPHSPAVLAFAGHGRGVDVIVGIRPDGSQRKVGEPEEYAEDYALQCVAAGYPTLAIEQFSFGRRCTKERHGEWDCSCHEDSMAAIALGESMMGWRVWDAMRALDYMANRPEVNPDRIALIGISGGGMATLWTAAMDERVYAAVSSGYYNTFRDSILGVHHCACNYVPGIKGLAEMSDLASLIAPRPFFVENGTRDPIFPIEAFRRAVAKGEEIYAAHGAPENFGSEIFENEHWFHGVQAFPFLNRVMKG